MHNRTLTAEQLAARDQWIDQIRTAGRAAYLAEGEALVHLEDEGLIADFPSFSAFVANFFPDKSPDWAQRRAWSFRAVSCLAQYNANQTSPDQNEPVPENIEQ